MTSHDRLPQFTRTYQQYCVPNEVDRPAGVEDGFGDVCSPLCGRPTQEAALLPLALAGLSSLSCNSEESTLGELGWVA